ncbi:MAG TPA: hypothetical protein VFL03_06515 [Candidatus Limnocylindrales bacterium]|nr:hypothetical protein [Candidatus Limnocylindrales bacterium]
MLRRIAVALGLSLAVLACGRALPGAEVGGIGIDQACAGVGMQAFLHGSPTDPRAAWVVSITGEEIDVLFPPGYTARFTPSLQVVDRTGAIAMEEGDYVYGACVVGDDSLMIAPDETLRLECGPVAIGACTDRAPQVASNQAGHSNRDVEAVTFLDADGRYSVTFKDGTSVTGTPMPGF